ncbi:radical SAM family heme chaperone HemW [bacterium]|nr:radical SAM family heme chaperone HemW [bacterium]
MTHCSTTAPLGLYLHFPFCEMRCHYCDFVTAVGAPEVRRRYVDALCAEIVTRAAEADRPITSVFFGGGTPSLLSPADIRQIGHALRAAFTVPPGVEWTFEANPESLSRVGLAAMRQVGANRLSLGVQSMDPETLVGLGRIHTKGRVHQAVALARQEGIDNLSLDLIYGWPYEDPAAWQRTLSEVLQLSPQHLSLYGLTVERGTPYAAAIRQGRQPAPDPDRQAEQYERAELMLEEAGYAHYEISNWAMAGRECAHNLNYWRRGEYLGLGLGAHSHLAGRRFHNTPRLEDYLRCSSPPARLDEEILSPTTRTAEWFMLGLRLAEGLDLSQWDRQVAPENPPPPAPFGRYLQTGLLRQEGVRVTLTSRGRLLADEILAALV